MRVGVEVGVKVGEDHLGGGDNLDTKGVAGGDVFHQAAPHRVDLPDKLKEKGPALGGLGVGCMISKKSV